MAVGMLITAVAAQAQVDSVRVYRSVDAAGVTRFSDRPPGESTAADALEIAISRPGINPIVQARQQAAREVTDRIAADRKQREAQRQRVFRAGQSAAAHAQTVPVQQGFAPQAVLPPVYPWLLVSPHQRNGYRGPHGQAPRLGGPEGGALYPHPGAWQGPPRNPYPYSIIRSRYRGVAAKVFYGR